ncbi:MAG: sulfocyanin-like copper-binding protein [Gemmatimonadaceae bacterium]
MRRVVALLLVTAAACGERQSSSSADAARADSSAAGYTVGQRPDRPDSARLAAGNGGDTTATRTTASAAVPNDSARRTPGAASAGPTATTAKTETTGKIATTATTTRTAARVTSRADSASTSRTGRRQESPNGVGAESRSDSAIKAATPAGPVRVNEFLTYDVRSRTVSLQLVSGYNGLNGSLNYNGATNGSHGLVVPAGWRVHIAVTNRDSDLQHSAIVVRKVLPPPIEPSDPAFPGAALPRLDEGLQEDETGTLDFVVGHPGHFMIACGVPGHAQAGEWLELVVANASGLPAYR